jgi:hypothetical protein
MISSSLNDASTLWLLVGTLLLAGIIPFLFLCFRLASMRKQVLKLMGSTGNHLKVSMSLYDVVSSFKAYFTIKGIKELTWISSSRRAAPKFVLGAKAPVITVHPLFTKGSCRLPVQLPVSGKSLVLNFGSCT